MPATSYKSTTESTLIADTEATGSLRALAHDRSFSIRVPQLTFSVDPEDNQLSLPVSVTFCASEFDTVADDMSKLDYRQLMKNLRGKDVLNVKRYPNIAFRGDYTGNLKSGDLAGQVTLRGQTHPLRLPVVVHKSETALKVQGNWEGKLSDVGLKPFAALLGAIRLKNWLRLRFTLELVT